MITSPLHHSPPRPNREAGFTYLGVLFAVALIGIALAAVGVVWHTTVQREKERELLFMGDQFRRAIAQFYAKNPSVPERLPRSLQELLQDDRQPTVQRYLRKIYIDPMTRKAEWGLVKTDAGGIRGVYSLSQEVPIKRANFLGAYEGFAFAATYSDWKFVYQPGEILTQPAAPPSPAAPGASEPAVPAPIAAVPPANPSPPPEKRKLDCVAIAQRDATVCDAQAARWGDVTRAECLASAGLRSRTCEMQAGEPPLPPLYIRYN